MPQGIGREILAMKRACEKMQPYQRPDCPICGWNLETTVDGLIHCRFCGWASEYPIKRDIDQ